MDETRRRLTRRRFLQGSVAAAASVMVVPRHVLGGPGHVAPSDQLGGALIGCGGRGPGTYGQMVEWGMPLDKEPRARCDVRWVGQVDNKTRYTDFRRVLDRKDIDIVAIGTPPHWHALISIAAMEAGKDVLCEKPMTRFVAEGRAVANAEKRYGRIFQVGTFGRFGHQGKEDQLRRKILKSGLLKGREVVCIHRGGLKVKEWSGLVNARPQPVPAWLDWDMYCGPSPLRPFHPHRFGGEHRGYWDYDGGGLGDMGQHAMDPFTWMYGRDHTFPVEIEAHAPPAHQEVAGMWGWVELKYADGFTLVLESGEWGKPYDRKKENRRVSLDDLDEESRKQVLAMPDEKLLNFKEAVEQRKPAGGNAEVAHRTACIMHLANIAIRVGRKIRFDPVTEQVIGDEEANRLAYQPMRAPWHL